MIKSRIVQWVLGTMTLCVVLLAFGGKSIDEWRMAIGFGGGLAGVLGYMAMLDVLGQWLYAEQRAQAVEQQLQAIGEDLPAPTAPAAADATAASRIAEIKVCRTIKQANEYLALGPEWRLHETYPSMALDDDDDDDDEKFQGDTRSPTENKSVIAFVLVRHETAADRARLATRDQVRKK